MSKVEWHSLDENETLKRLESNEKGLTIKEAEKRLLIYGKNEIKETHKFRPLIIFLSQFNSFFVLLLAIAAGISLIMSHLIDFYVILAILLLNAIIGFVQNYKAEKAILQLKKSLIQKARVFREGVLYEIPFSEIVPGDILVLNEGDKIPADARIIEGHEFQCNEAILTGESLPVDKISKVLKAETTITDRVNIVYAGTTVARGSAKAVVIFTGMNTEFGKIASLLQETSQEKTPLQIKLDSFAKKLGIFILILCALIGLLGIYFGLDKTEAFLMVISLAVAAVPEGLPAAITICLAIAVQRMYKSNSLVRRLPASETLGRVTVICSDKTGTMTEEKLEVVSLFYDNSFKTKEDICKNKMDKTASMLLKINCLCNNARFERLDGKYSLFGDPTEQALLKLALDCGFNKEKLTLESPSLKRFEFTSTRKMMSIVRPNGNETISYVKGAPEVIIENSGFEFVNGRIEKLNAKRKSELLVVYNEIAQQGLRVLGFAFKKINKNFNQDDAEKDLIFVGFQGLLDPPRKEILPAIIACQDAGISVKMITGDALLTAKHVAREIGLEGESISGVELEKLDDIQLKKRLNSISVFARVSPEQKLRIVSLLKEKGEIVAVTGDGVNDAPALKKADIGVAMGIRGTDAAREVSDIILLDDNFSSIVKAVEEGRIVHDNTKKFTKFLLSVNFAELFLIMYALLLSLPLPLLPLHILWINLITDSIPALALGFEREKDVMKRKPAINEGILNGSIMFIVIAGVLACIVKLSAFYLGNFGMDIDKARTIVLTTAIFFEMFFVFTCRSDKPLQKIGFFSNKYLVGAVFISILLHVIMIYSPLNMFLKLTPLGLNEWLIILGLSITGLFLFELWKNIRDYVRSKKNFDFK